jgi:hypothetical protein
METEKQPPANQNEKSTLLPGIIVLVTRTLNVYLDVLLWPRLADSGAFWTLLDVSIYFVMLRRYIIGVVSNH